jgi:nucleoid-associated protein YgaU
MRPVTKVILVLSLVALAVVVLYCASKKWGGTATKPAAPALTQKTDQPPGYNDPVATYQRWRDRIAGQGDAAPPTDNRRPEGRDLKSTSRDEGTAVAHRLEGPVAGADPPGPVLRPEGIVGEIFRGRLAPPSEAAGWYTVVQGDTLHGISVKRYGDARYVSQIVAANPGLNPDRLRVGEHLTLPDVSKKAEKPGAVGSPAEPPAKVYVVQRNDTLISIAKKVYGDSSKYPRIYEANKDILSSPNARLYVGQKLRLPESR